MFFVSDLVLSPGDGSMGCWGLAREGRFDAEHARAVTGMGGGLRVVCATPLVASADSPGPKPGGGSMLDSP